MNISRSDMDKAVEANLITSDQADKLWLFWQNKSGDTPQFKLSHVMYYFGGLLAISAVTLFVTQAWDQLRGFPLFIISALLFVLGGLLSRHFLSKQLPIPAGIMATFSLAIVPLAVYNLQIIFGFLPDPHYQYADFNYWINAYWVPMEFATLIAGLVLFYLTDFPFLLFPIAITLWYMSMDLFSLFFHTYDFTQRAQFSMAFGLIIIACAVYMDFKYEDDSKDYAFWLYIFGVMTFWGGLTCLHSDSEIRKFIYCLINIALILISVFLDRRVFAVFGAIGVFGYLSYLAFSVFANSLGFPIVLVFLGILIIVAATRWGRVEEKLFVYFRPYMPKKLLKHHSYNK